MSGASIRAGAAFVELTTNDSKLQKGLKKAQASLNKFGDSCIRLGNKVVGVGAAIGAAFGAAAMAFAGFDDEMRMTQAVTGATGEQFEELTELAKKLGRETSFTAKQVAEGMTSLGRMGFSAQEIQGSISAMLNLSRATGTDLAQAAEIASSQLRIFKLDASNSANVADVLTTTANKSAQTLTDLGEALKMAAPSAAAAGESLQDVSAALGIMANMGVKGTMAGTAIRNIYQKMADPAAIAAMAQQGIAAQDSAGNLRKLADVMTDVAKVINKMPSGKKLEFVEQIAGLRGQLGTLSIGSNIEQLNAFRDALENCGGTAAATATAMDAGLGGALRILQSAWEGVTLALGKGISQELIMLVRKVTEILGSVARWIEKNNALVVSIAKWAAVSVAAGGALIALGAVCKLVAFSIGGLSLVITATSKTVGFFITMITGLRTAVLAFQVSMAIGCGALASFKIAVTALLASNPVGWILLAVGALAGLVYCLGRATKNWREYAASAREAQQQSEAQIGADRQKMARLEELNQLQNLNNDQLIEAKRLIVELASAYGVVVGQVDTINKKLILSKDAQTQLNKAMFAKQKAELEISIKKQDQAIAENQEKYYDYRREMRGQAFLFGKESLSFSFMKNGAKQIREETEDMTKKRDADLVVLAAMNELDAPKSTAETNKESIARILGSDGPLNDKLTSELDKLLANDRSQREQKWQEYQNILAPAREGMLRAADRSPAGSFFAEQVARMVGFGGNEAQRTAQATENSARSLRNIERAISGNAGLLFT